ncbi:hypothetical protein [Bacillus sp. ISL-37]|uniref:hypothetical protein n=1 Tax=Bacillus sp. ISL-37 TaxID=2819123 RepID=UPI001BEB69A4|nr:hypothetical protein [Bacillus sp. ISL-37]MBT2684045.1 hypothetical protein [Bacillus sp. ISL-37]
MGAWVRGDPTGAESTEEAPRSSHGKRSDWNGNQQPTLTQPKYKKAAMEQVHSGFLKYLAVISAGIPLQKKKLCTSTQLLLMDIEHALLCSLFLTFNPAHN